MSYIIRIDDRLLHGQVIEGWVKPLKIEKIVIASDIICYDSMQQSLYSISTPEYVKLECLSLDSTAKNIALGSFDKCNALILISSLKELYEVVLKVKSISASYEFPTVNVGGIRYIEGRVEIYKALYLSKQDLEVIKELNKYVKLEYYVLPKDPKISINEKIQEIEEIIERKK